MTVKKATAASANCFADVTNSKVDRLLFNSQDLHINRVQIGKNIV
ncbi:hypothetical protein [Microcoleus sp. LEGE 07076]|nr:hypothetical protein [Microcoleus sp. LEGE 07076]